MSEGFMSYVVQIGYDAEEGEYRVLSSDIPGLNVEADAFVAIAHDLAPDLVGDHPAGSSIDFCFERAFA